MLKMDIIDVYKPVVTVELDSVPLLDALQKAVGGHIESVPYFTRYKGQECVAFCDEEGKFKDPCIVNVNATELWYTQAPHFFGKDFLVGPIIILYGDKKLLERI